MLKKDEKAMVVYRKALITATVVIAAVVLVGAFLVVTSILRGTFNYAQLVGGMVIGIGFGLGWGFVYGERVIIRLYSTRQSASKSLPNSASAVQPTIYCSSCGAENLAEVNFCIKCGKKILKS